MNCTEICGYLQHRQSNKHRQALPLLRHLYLQKLDCLFIRKPPRSFQNLWCSESSLGIAQGTALRFIRPDTLPLPSPSLLPPFSLPPSSHLFLLLRKRKSCFRADAWLRNKGSSFSHLFFFHSADVYLSGKNKGCFSNRT